MPRKRSITIIGPGRLGTSLAHALREAGYRLDEIVFRADGKSARTAGALARRLHARARPFSRIELTAGIIWFCVGDSDVAACAQALSDRDWTGKIAFHASGALPSDALGPLRDRGAAVAAVHPMMSFVTGVKAPLGGVTFSLEGDPRALRAARPMIRSLGARSIAIGKTAKPLYHAFGAFTSPLLIAAIATGERIAAEIGFSPQNVRSAVAPIFEQTLRNYLRGGSKAAFTGPLVRGDVETVRKHLDALRALPDVRAVYVALVRAAIASLPVRNAAQIAALLDQ